MTLLQQEVELGQFKRDEKGLVLPLRSHFLDGIPIQQHLQLITVDAHGRMPHQDVTLPVVPDPFLKIILVKL